jgi:hypothetical protein
MAAIAALAALVQDNRLDTYGRLVQAGPRPECRQASTISAFKSRMTRSSATYRSGWTPRKRRVFAEGQTTCCYARSEK